MIGFIRQFYIDKRLYVFILANIFVLIMGFFFPLLFVVGKFFLIGLSLIFLIDVFQLFLPGKNALKARRETPEKLSNGDINTLSVFVKNNYNYDVFVEIIDEIPDQFQVRDFSVKSQLKSKQEKQFTYDIKPVKRGEYQFNKLNVFVNTRLKIVRKRFRFEANQILPVYPSFLQMKKYELYAISNKLTEVGIKKIRRLGHQMEFDHIKEYVRGDDYRKINWKATARRNKPMVNLYQDEKAQNVYFCYRYGQGNENAI